MLDTMIRRGFTVVELVITITIMGILLTLAVVSVNATQANGRDAERKADAESLAMHLERYQSSKNSAIAYSGVSYPGTTYLTTANIATYLPDLQPSIARAPGVADTAGVSIAAATNTTQTVDGVTPQPSKSNDVYVYQPLTATGTLCTDPASTGECRRFNLYYYQEVDGSVKMISSKAQ